MYTVIDSATSVMSDFSERFQERTGWRGAD